MKYFFSIILFLIAFSNLPAQQPLNENFVLVIHGGAGTINRGDMTPEMEKAYKDALTAALQKGYDKLKSGSPALDAIQAAITYMEDSPLFNAGKGAVLTSEGKAELDAAIMNGSNLTAGSVAGVTTVKNPILAARAVMEKSVHVMMAGKGADQFAASQGLEIVDPSYFIIEKRVKALEKVKAADSIKIINEKSKKSTGNNNSEFPKPLLKQKENHDYKYGTVGAVALDRYGNMAAGTSTGGMMNKKFGRIGDAPVIGAGTYANNATCAISCTGWGEYFIRLVMAKSVSDLMEYKNLSLENAANEMIMKKLPSLGGDGGLIAVDKNGNIAMPFNTSGMYRGYVKMDGKVVVEIYK